MTFAHESAPTGTCSVRSEKLMFRSKIKKRCFQTGATSLKLIGRMLIELRKICGSDVWKEIKVKKYNIDNNSWAHVYMEVPFECSTR